MPGFCDNCSNTADTENTVDRDEVDRLRKRFMKLDKVWASQHGTADALRDRSQMQN